MLAPQRRLLERALDVQRQLVEPDRLENVVRRAARHRFDRGIDGAERGHHDHGNLDIDRVHRREHVEPVDVGHPQVGDHQLRHLAPERLERRLPESAVLHW